MTRFADMDMRVDEAGHHELARVIVDRDARPARQDRRGLADRRMRPFSISTAPSSMIFNAPAPARRGSSRKLTRRPRRMRAP